VDTDPGPEFWARQHDQLVVINAMDAAVQADPDRFTGLVPNGSGELTVRLVDPAAADEPAFAALLSDAATAGIAVTISPAPRPLAVLEHVMAEATRSIGQLGPVSAGAEWWIDSATATVRVRVAAAHAATMRAALGGDGDALVVEEVPIEEDMTAFPWPQRAPEPGWPVPDPPVAEAAGHTAATLAGPTARRGSRSRSTSTGTPCS
jgi:hypothetical protein